MEDYAFTAQTVFNDVMIRESCIAWVLLLDLRLVCDAEADDVNLIELSVAGRAKMATTISALGRKLYQGAEIQRSLPVGIAKPARGAWAHQLCH